MGPGPENVVQKYTDVIFFYIKYITKKIFNIYYFQKKYFGKTFMPPYWALGFQISRYGYENLDDMKAVLGRFQDNDIPLVNLIIN